MTTTLLSNYKIWGTLLISQLSPFFLFFFLFVYQLLNATIFKKSQSMLPQKQLLKSKNRGNKQSLENACDPCYSFFVIKSKQVMMMKCFFKKWLINERSLSFISKPGFSK